MTDETRTVNRGRLLRLSDDEIALMYGLAQRQKSDAEKQIRLMSESAPGKAGLYKQQIKMHRKTVKQCNKLRRKLTK